MLVVSQYYLLKKNSLKRKSLPNDKKEQLNSEKRSELEKKKEILENKLENKDIYVKNERGEYPIHEAVVKGKVKIFKYLIKKK